MQDIHHDDICRCTDAERQMLCVSDAIEPVRELDVGRDHLRQAMLEISNATTDFDRRADNAFLDNT